MNKNIIKIIILTILIGLITWCIFSYEWESVKPVNTQNLSSKKIEWGIKRNKDNQQPDVGAINEQMMKESDSIYLGSKDKKVIYLTFDSGYEAGYTEDILNTLKEQNVTATFFITAHYLNNDPELVQKMIDNGNIVRKSHCKSSLLTKLR